jgi:hypothetical protein
LGQYDVVLPGGQIRHELASSSPKVKKEELETTVVFPGEETWACNPARLAHKPGWLINPKFTQKKVSLTAPPGMPQHLQAQSPNLRICCHFAQNNHPRNLHKKRVSFTAPPGMPQISVPVAIFLKQSPPKFTQKNGVVYGTPWDAPDQRTCCHFAQNMYKSEGIQKKRYSMHEIQQYYIKIPLFLLE